MLATFAHESSHTQHWHTSRFFELENPVRNQGQPSATLKKSGCDARKKRINISKDQQSTVWIWQESDAVSVATSQSRVLEVLEIFLVKSQCSFLLNLLV